MPKGNMRPPSPLPTRKEHMDKTYPEAASVASVNTKVGGSGKPPNTPFRITTLGSPGDDNDKHDARSIPDEYANSQIPVTGLLKRKDTFSSGAGSARLNQTSDLRLSGYPLGFSGWFDHAESQDAKMRRNHEEYIKYKGYPKGE